VIQISELTKVYGRQRGVTDISFEIKEGEIVGFLGPNGAGKSTVMNILCGYLSPTKGSVKVNGHDTIESPMEARTCIGYLPEQPPLYMDMTVKEYLHFVYEIKKAAKRVSVSEKAHIDKILDIVKIKDVENRRVGNLSKGYKQRVGLAQALVGDPEVLVLDEPTVGLDPMQIIEIREAISSLRGQRTILLSSHILSEVQAICSRVLVINEGKIIADDTPKNLSDALSKDESMVVSIDGDRDRVYKLLRSIDGVTAVKDTTPGTEGGVSFIVNAVKGTDLNKKIFALLSEESLPLLLLKPHDLSLEDVFLTLTKNKGGAKK